MIDTVPDSRLVSTQPDQAQDAGGGGALGLLPVLALLVRNRRRLDAAQSR